MSGLILPYSLVLQDEYTGELPVDPDNPSGGGTGGGERGAPYVSWRSLGNRTTAEGSYLDVSYPAKVILDLYTGTNDNHTYSFAVSEYDDTGQKVGVLGSWRLGNAPLPTNRTYTFTIYLNTKLSLSKGHRYVLHVLDVTTGTYVGSVGIIPQNAVNFLGSTYQPTELDSWFYNPGDAQNPAVGDIGDTVLPPDGGGGSGFEPGGNPDNTDWSSGILGTVRNFFAGIVGFFTGFADAVSGFASALTSAISGVSTMFTTIGAFLGSFFSWLPSEISAVLVLGVALCVAASVVHFVRG